MRRKAILIASEKESRKSQSNENNVAFLNYLLQTEYGGFWKKSEIFVLINPTLNAVLSILNKSDDTYRFMYFSGHGCIAGGRQYVLIENKIVDISLLVNKVHYENVLFDCCRNIQSYNRLEKIYQLHNADSNFIKQYKKVNTYSPFLRDANKSVIFTTRQGKTAYTSSWCSCFIYLFAKSVKKIKELQTKKPVSLFFFLKLITFFFSRSRVIQECEYYIYNRNTVQKTAV